MAELTKIAKEQPIERSARSLMVRAHIELGKFDQTEKILTEAINRNARDAEALQQRATLFLRSGTLALAESDIIAALRSRPQSSQAHYIMAQIHGRRGMAAARKHEQADRTLREALKLDASVPEATVALNLLGAASAQQR